MRATWGWLLPTGAPARDLHQPSALHPGPGARVAMLLLASRGRRVVPPPCPFPRGRRASRPSEGVGSYPNSAPAAGRGCNPRRSGPASQSTEARRTSWGPARPGPPGSPPAAACCRCAAHPADSESPPLPHREEPGRGHQPAPRPPAWWGGTALGQPQGPAPQTFSPYLRFLPSSTQPSPPPSAGAGTRAGGLLLGTDPWGASSVLLPRPPAMPPHLSPPPGSPPALPRRSWFSSSNAPRVPTLDVS